MFGKLRICWLLLCLLVVIMGPLGVVEASADGIVRVVTAEGETIDLYSGSYALVIGNGSYDKGKGWGPLPGAIRDTKDVAQALERNGFVVTLKTDLTRPAFQRAMSEFIRTHGEAKDNRLLFYYAGHGYTEKMANGEELGYIVMVDSPDPERDAVGFDLASLDMEYFLNKAKMMKARHGLFMFDCCFSGSIFNLRERVMPESIKDNVKYPVRQFITAGRADEPVPDCSVFKQVFLDLLEGRGREPIPDGFVTGEELGSYLKHEVPKYNSSIQHPQCGKIWDPKLNQGDFVFVVKGRGTTKAPTEARTGSLRVETTPVGAEIFVDGEKAGKAPLMIRDLSPGQVRVLATLEGHESKEEVALVREGKENRLRLSLEKSVRGAGTLEVRSEPSGASWYLDGAYAGTTPDEMKDVSVGRHRVTVRKANRPDWEETFEVRPGRRIPVEARLEAEKKGPHAGDLWTDPITGMEFVWVPGGCYEMGCGNWTSNCRVHETPVHEVCVHGFWMGRTEVTRGQWERVMDKNLFKKMGENLFKSFKKRDDYPVEGVSWEDAKAFIEKLQSMNVGMTFSLPSEAEWEYACRSGGKAERYSGGNNPGHVAWYGEGKAGSTHRVGTKTPNSLGLCDMSGNVSEWVEDIYAEHAYQRHGHYNPVCVSGGADRVIRGGSCNFDPRGVRCASRNHGAPAERYGKLGFRLLMGGIGQEERRN